MTRHRDRTWGLFKTGVSALGLLILFVLVARSLTGPECTRVTKQGTLDAILVVSGDVAGMRELRCPECVCPEGR